MSDNADRPIMPGWSVLLDEIAMKPTTRVPSGGKSHLTYVQMMKQKQAAKEAQKSKSGYGMGKPQWYTHKMMPRTPMGESQYDSEMAKPSMPMKPGAFGSGTPKPPPPSSETYAQGKPKWYVQKVIDEEEKARIRKTEDMYTERSSESELWYTDLLSTKQKKAMKANQETPQQKAQKETERQAVLSLLSNYPVQQSEERNRYIRQIVANVNSLCTRGESAIAPKYIYGAFGLDASGTAFYPDPYRNDARHGTKGNPFLWVLTDRHIRGRDDYREGTDTVTAFCIAVVMEDVESNSLRYEAMAVCSNRRFGMELMRKALKYANIFWDELPFSYKVGKTYYAQILVLSPELSVKYNEIAMEFDVFGKRMNVTDMGGGHRFMELLLQDYTHVPPAQTAATSSGSSVGPSSGYTWPDKNNPDEMAAFLKSIPEDQLAAMVDKLTKKPNDF